MDQPWQTGFRFQPYFHPAPFGIKIVESADCVERIYKPVKRKWRRWEWFRQYVLFAFYRWDYTPIRWEETVKPTMYRVGNGPGFTIVCHPVLAAQIKQELLNRNLEYRI